MKNAHYRIEVTYEQGKRPRQFHFNCFEGHDAFIEACDLIAQTLDDSLSPKSVTITNLAKIEERKATDKNADGYCNECGTPEHIINEINASLLKKQ